jgi:hypothetical protein
MKIFRSYWPIPASLVFMAAMWGLLQTGPTNPQATTEGAPVMVINTPLPISPTGTQAVSGTVSAAQSGSWNVGINGTPSVSISGTPSVNVNNMPTVGIDSLNNTVKLLQDPENPARQPFQSAVVCTFLGEPFCLDTSSITVPSGKRLVIEFVSVLMTTSTGLKPLDLVLKTTVGNNAVFHRFGPTLQFDDGTTATSVGSFPTRLYADDSSTVFIGCVASNLSSSGSCEASVSGYLVNLL